jgi:hypothetical protein
MQDGARPWYTNMAKCTDRWKYSQSQRFIGILCMFFVSTYYYESVSSCSGTYVQGSPTSHKTCTPVQLTKLYALNMTVTHCQNSQEGVFIIKHALSSFTRVKRKMRETQIPEQLLSECTGRPLYRVRITGPEIFYADIEEKDPSIVMASYRLHCGGHFHAEISQLYSEFSFCDLPKINFQQTVASLNWSSNIGSKAWCTHVRNPVCASGELRGRWVADMSVTFAKRLLSQMMSTHIFRHSPGVGAESLELQRRVVNARIIRWQPMASCTIDPTPALVNKWKRKCNTASGLVCFAGDSQMRHMYTMATAIMSDNFTMVATSGSTMKSVPRSAWSRYVGVYFGNERVDLRNCTSLVINIGHWPIAHTAGRRPWTAQRYKRAVQGMLDRIQSENPLLSTRITWLSTQPRALAKWLDGSEKTAPSDWRTDPYIMQQNAITSELGSSREPPLAYIDTFSLLYPFSDFAYDESHYLGTPGYWAAALVLHQMCV